MVPAADEEKNTVAEKVGELVMRVLAEDIRPSRVITRGSLENAILVDGDRIVNEEGLRYDDEFVRHKALDCIGDFYLAGYRIEGRIITSRPGHAVNNKALHALFASPSAWTLDAAVTMLKASTTSVEARTPTFVESAYL